MKKASIELSINFTVILLISIVVFALGISFIYSVMRDANKIADTNKQQIDRRISELMCDNTEKVCLDKSNMIIGAGEDFNVITARVLNIDEGEQFWIVVRKGLYVSKDLKVRIEHGEPGYDNKIIVIPASRNERIVENKALSFGIGFEAPKDTKRGTYVFDLHIVKLNPMRPYDFVKIRITVE